MKKTIILLCILFLQSSIFSQEYYENLLSRTVHNHIRTMTTIGDKLVVGGHSYDCDVPYLSIFDETGQQGWQSYPGGGYGWVTDLITDSNDLIVGTSSYSQGDDYATEADGFYFFKYNSAGTQTTIKKFEGYYFGVEFAPVLEHRDSGYLVGARDTLYHLDNDGAIINRTTMPEGNLAQLEPYDSSSYLMAQKVTYNEYLITIRSYEDSIIHSYTFNGKLSGIAILPPYLYFSDDNIVTRWNVQTATETDITTAFGFVPKGMNNTDGEIYLWGTNLVESKVFIHKLDSLDTFEQVFSFDNGRRNIVDIIQNGSNAYIGGQLDVEGVENGFTGLDMGFVQRYVDWQEPELEFLDIAIENLELNGEASQTLLDIFGEDDYYYEISAFLQVEIVNSGEVPVDYLVLSTPNITGFNCWQLRNFIPLYNLDLQPGESTFQTIETRAYVVLNPNEPYEINACVFVAAPNEKIDQVFENNNFCGTIITDTDEEIIDPDINVFPNPASDWLTIDTHAHYSINQIQVFDLTGRLVRTEAKLRDVNPRISVAGIAAGMYYVKLETNEGWLSRKIIIE